MPDIPDFAPLVERLRRGDPLAARELVSLYEPVIRTWVQLRLHDPGRTPSFDWEDVFQSVMRSFFVRMALGQYDLHNPRELEGLLFTMTNHKVIDRLRKEPSLRFVTDGASALTSVAEPDPPADRDALSFDLERILRLFSPIERAMAEMRADGRSWSEIAAALGGTADARRVQFSRAIARVRHELGLDAEDTDA